MDRVGLSRKLHVVTFLRAQVSLARKVRQAGRRVVQAFLGRTSNVHDRRACCGAGSHIWEPDTYSR